MMWMVAGVAVAVVLGVRVVYRLRSGVCRSETKLLGKTVIVTGASAGIGKETARDLAERGARVILACRNLEKAQKVADDIINTTGNGQVVVRKLDTSDLSSVRSFAKQILEEEKNLHILINNAGISGASKYTLTTDGLELTMATNHYGHFLLTNLLMGLLKSSSPARIINVSSKAHYFCDVFDPSDLNYEKRPYPGSIKAYAQSKLANILFTVELAEKLRSGVTANSLHPGIVYTEIFYKETKNWLRYIISMFVNLVGKDEKAGAQTTIYLAVSEDVENVTGKYFTDCQELLPSGQLATNKGLAKKFWEASEKAVKLSPEEQTF